MKLAIIINESLPQGLRSNTAAVLGISLGKAFPEIVRESAYDSEGNEYSGITSVALPILSADEGKIKEIVTSVQGDDLTLIPFTGIAQRSRDYDAYKGELEKTHPDQVTYSGIALAGSERKVRKYTGALPLLK